MRPFKRELKKVKYLKLTMPQLNPFYFKNEVIFTFVTLFIILYLISRLFLPLLLRLIIIRAYLTA